MPNPVILVLMGGVTGLLAGMLGAGGGFATVVLLLAAGLDAHHAVGTSLLYTVVIGAWGTAVHLRQDTASWRLALALGIPSLATAIVGAQMAEGLSERALTAWFAALTAVVAIVFLIPRSTGTSAEATIPPVSGAQLASGAALRLGARPLAVAIAGGAAIGLMKGLFGVGGGFLLVPFMVLALGVDEHIAVGSSLFAILLGSVAGGVRHALLGNVNVEVFLYLVPGGLIGSFAGASAVRRMSPRAIRRAFALLMTASAVYLIIRAA